jgi:hypothetical protein
VMCATGYCVMCRSKSCDTKSAPTEGAGITRDRNLNLNPGKETK